MKPDSDDQDRSAGTRVNPNATTPELKTFWLTIFIFAVVATAFYPLIRGDFINYDDDIYVTANYPVQSGFGVKQLGWAFSNIEGGNWHPLTWISHMLDCRLYGTKPWGHHLTSVLFHALNAALLFRAMRALTGTTWRSAAVALLFGLHPLRVESVAWVSERKDVLCGTFWLLTMWAYARYAREFKAPGSKYKVHYALALLFFLCALMSKPMAVTLPFVLVLMDFWPLARIAELKKPEVAVISQIKLPRVFAEKWPFFVLSAAASVVTYFAQKAQGAVIEFLPQGVRLENALIGCCRYVGKFLYPEKLAVLYPYPANGWPLSEAVGAGILLATVTALALVVRRTQTYCATGWLWFLGTLVPVIGLVQVGSQSIADRYTYLPAIGLNIIVVWGIWNLSQRWRIGKVAVPVAVIAGIICVALTERQITFWQDSGKLFSHAIAVTENSFQARKALGDFYWSEGNDGDAVTLYRQAIEIYPNFEGAYLNLGVVFSQTGRSHEAEEEFRRATVLDPHDASAFNDLATVVAATNVDEALTLFKHATELDPNYADAHKNLGLALDTKGRHEEAMVEYQRVIGLRPDAETHFLLGMDLGRLGRPDAAAKEFNETLKLRPDHAGARQALEKIKSLRAK